MRAHAQTAMHERILILYIPLLPAHRGQASAQVNLGNHPPPSLLGPALMSQHPPAPAPGDRILVLKPRWLRLVLGRQKTLEIRGSPLAAGPAWLGARGTLYGSCVLGAPSELGADDWAAERSRHMVPGVPPYMHPWASPVHDVRQLRPLRSYRHPKGAIGIVGYAQGQGTGERG